MKAKMENIVEENTMKTSKFSSNYIFHEIHI